MCLFSSSTRPVMCFFRAVLRRKYSINESVLWCKYAPKFAPFAPQIHPFTSSISPVMCLFPVALCHRNATKNATNMSQTLRDLCYFTLQKCHEHVPYPPVFVFNMPCHVHLSPRFTSQILSTCVCFMVQIRPEICAFCYNATASWARSLWRGLRLRRMRSCVTRCRQRDSAVDVVFQCCEKRRSAKYVSPTI